MAPIPPPRALVEVTTRTFQSRLLLTPKPLLNRIILGALARASHRYGVGAVAFAFLSNHYHLPVRIYASGGSRSLQVQGPLYRL